MAATEKATQIVVIGSSAGGFETLSTLLAALRKPFPCPIVAVQPLPSDRLGPLRELLERNGRVPVRTVSEWTLLEPGVTYLIPGGCSVETGNGRLMVRNEVANPPQPPIDSLLKSAAAEFGDGLVAVFLGGCGSEISAAAREIKRNGGTVVVETAAGTPHGPPDALAPGVADIVTECGNIAPVLDRLVAAQLEPAGAAESADSELELAALLDDIRTRSGIDFRNYKPATLRRRLRRRMAATECPDLAAYRAYLTTRPDEYQRLINGFLVKVTEFMRDADLFAYLGEHVLPELLSSARSRDNELRIWSAGCATGEEAYSLAMLVLDALGDAADRFTVRVFATDLDAESIAFARRAVYPAESVAALPPETVSRHFVSVNGSYQVRKRVRSITVFGEHDLAQRSPFPRIDLVMCRNVLIYFTPELQKRTLQLFAFSLRDAGYLVLGRAETTSPLSDYFVPHHAQQKIYRRQGERLVIPSARSAPVPARVGAASAAGRPGPAPPAPSVRPLRESVRPRPAGEVVAADLPFGLVAVDRRYDILEINAAARRLLGIHGPAVGEDFIHLAAGIPARDVRGAIDEVFRTAAAARLDDVPVEGLDAAGRQHLRFDCLPHRTEPDGRQVQSVLVCIVETTAAAESRRALREALERESAAGRDAEAAAGRLRIEIERLEAENRRLAAANAEHAEARRAADAARGQEHASAERALENNRLLVRANEELTALAETLRSSNEELLLTNEEAQAATEEVETLNEELQATNEELETLNEELQATIEELNTTNADLEARGREVQEMGRMAEAERARLSAVLLSMGDAVLAVDGAGRTVLTNAAYRASFRDSTFVPLDQEGRPLPAEASPLRRAAAGESFRTEFTLPLPEGKRGCFEATCRPIRRPDGTSDGGVIVIRDITERSLHRLQDRFLAMAGHELRTPLVPLRGYMEMLLKLFPEDGGSPAERRARQFAGIALGEVRRLAALVNDLVDATRLQTGKFRLNTEALDLTALVTRSIPLGQTMTKGQVIRARLPSERLMIRGDAARLEQVLFNLLNNAATYAPNSQFIDLALGRQGDEARISVQDYGPGIPAADRANIFSSFYQVARPDIPGRTGLGLGLYICREIIAAHSGRITLESEEGKGSTFTVRLPLQTGADASPHGA